MLETAEMQLAPFGTIEPSKANYRSGEGGRDVCGSCAHFLPNAANGLPRCAKIWGAISGAWVCDLFSEDEGGWTREKAEWTSRKSAEDALDLADMKGRYSGERVFIIGTGPSLDKVKDDELGRLAGELTFGVNTLLAYERLPFTPTLYCVMESSWLQGISITGVIEKFRKLPEMRFYGHHWPLEDLEAWTFVRLDSGISMQTGEFMGLGDTLPYIVQGKSVVAMAVQIACWLGFGEVYLLGVDATSYGHAGKLDEDDTANGHRGRQDGFLRSMVVAERVMAEGGRKLVNLTAGGDLPITREKLRDVL